MVMTARRMRRLKVVGELALSRTTNNQILLNLL